jgi:hypothetical protein
VPTNTYNGTAADLVTIEAGSPLYRIRRTPSTYAANSFNPSPKSLGDPLQGRFEPTDPAVGGYLYVAAGLVGAVAEGILRNQDIPSTRLVPRFWLSDKMLAIMTLNENISAAAVYGSHAAKLNLDASFLCCPSSRYDQTRTTGTAILLNTAAARALAYPCRNIESENALMLVTRSATPSITVNSETEILKDAATAQLILDTLDQTFGLKYAGALP